MSEAADPRLGLDFCGMHFNTPLVLLSGCVGFGEEYTRVAGFSNRDAGAVCLKGTTGSNRPGNPAHRVYETPGGMLNAIGLQNPGVDTVVDEIMAEMEKAEQAADAQRQAGIEEERRTQEKLAAQSRGKSRDDLQRFAGLYGEPKREIFVTVSCDGYLVTGPMWADVGPWWMRSAADKVFTYADSWQSFSMEFEADGDGRIVRMKHEIEGAPSPMEHAGPLPDEWGDCLERPLR